MEREERFSKDRLSMIEEQLRRRGITDPRLLQAMASVPRHAFVPPEEQNRAYEDRPLPIGEGQTISQPYMVAVMSQALFLQGHETVLEIGTGSGYQTAVLAELSRKVCTIERIPRLAFIARKTLQELGYRNIQYCEGDGTRGWPEEGPFDAIIVTAGAPMVPEALKAQLADGGRLSIPVGPKSSQTLVRLTRQKDRFKEEEMMGCVFVPLVGDLGWTDE